MSPINTASYWLESTHSPKFSSLKEDLAVDVLVVGAGITGVTAAYLLKRAGLTVALVEKGRCLQAETAFTTAHLTCVTDTRLADLVKTFGFDHAQAVWDAGLAAINTIEALIRRERILCQFEWVPAYLFHPITSAQGEPEEYEGPDLQEEAEVAAQLGFDAVYIDSVPFIDRPGIRFDSQAKFHPRKYLLGLLKTVPGRGSYVFENTEVSEIEGDRITVHVDGGHRIHCGHIILATHVPLQGKTGIASATLLQSRLELYTTYAIAGWVPRGTLPEALFWDTGDPYDYFRVDRRHDHDFVIFGGEDHKTGQASDTTRCFAQLEKRLRALLPTINVTHRWSGQVIETNDGLPYIGETAKHQLVATGYSGNGMTFGTLAAMMHTDTIIGRTNPWTELFDAGRTKIRGGAWDYIRANKDYLYYMIRDRFAGVESRPLRSIPRGTGDVVRVDGKDVAAFRGQDGQFTLRSAVCTHMGCYVHWNTAERTWDCPCHGSRFKTTGDVISGPAESPLPESSPLHLVTSEDE